MPIRPHPTVSSVFAQLFVTETFFLKPQTCILIEYLFLKGILFQVLYNKKKEKQITFFHSLSGFIGQS